MDRRTERRRSQFAKLKSWRRNSAGNWQIELRNFRVTVFHKPRGWSAVISHPTMPTPAFTREDCGSFAEAQMAAFDLLTSLERRGAGPTATPPSPRSA